MNELEYYEARMDMIFAKGNLWKHRTLRTVFDPPSSEWSYTTMHEKVAILKKIVENGENLYNLIDDYKDRYIEQNRRDIANETGNALAFIIEHILKPEE
jgi:hypothetical protein